MKLDTNHQLTASPVRQERKFFKLFLSNILFLSSILFLSNILFCSNIVVVIINSPQQALRSAG